MSCAKIAEPIEMPFGLWTPVGPGKHVLGGSLDRPMSMGNLYGKGHAELIDVPFWLWTRVGQRKHVLGGVHTCATWRIPMNCQRAVAMRSFCLITLTTCYS